MRRRNVAHVHDAQISSLNLYIIAMGGEHNHDCVTVYMHTEIHTVLNTSSL